MRRVVLLVVRIVNADAADLDGPLPVAVQRIEERGAEVREHPAETPGGMRRHVPHHLRSLGPRGPPEFVCTDDDMSGNPSDRTNRDRRDAMQSAQGPGSPKHAMFKRLMFG
ncbi:hypothetical protein GCM10022284_09370 [Streptomyces hundungensis]